MYLARESSSGMATTSTTFHTTTWRREAEEAVFDPTRAAFAAHGGRAGVIGRTVEGRFLVVIVERGGDHIRVVTARYARANEKKIYRKRNR